MCKKTRLAALFFAASMLASCGSENSELQTSQGDTDTTVAETEKVDYLSSIPKADFGGDEFRIIVQSASDRPNVHTEEETGEVINDQLIARDRLISEMFSCDVTYTEYTDRGLLYKDLTRLITAGEDAYDMVMTTLTDSGLGNLASAGMLYDLGSLGALDLTAEHWCKSSVETMTFGDKIYAAAGPISLCYCYSPYVLFANLDMAEDFKLGNLYETVENGKWTLDEMSKCMKNIYEDLNQNGEIDIDDRFPLTVTNEAGNAFYIGCGQRMTEKTSSEVTFNIDSVQSIDVLDKLNSLFKTDEVLKTDSFASDATLSNYKTKAFVDSNAHFCAAPMQWGVINFRDMDADYAILPFPKYDENQDNYYSHINTYFPVAVGIPATSKRAEKTASVMEAMAYYSNENIVPKITNVVLKEKIARDENSKKMIDIIYQNATVEFNCVFNLAGTASLLREYAAGVSDNFTSQYASLKTQAQTKLSELTELLMEK